MAQGWGAQKRDKKKDVIFKVNEKVLRVVAAALLATLVGVVAVVVVSTLHGQRSNHKIAFSKDQEWRLKSVSPRDWNARDVQAWASELGLDAFMQGFRRSSVDGELLLSITEDEVRKDLKVTDNLLGKTVDRCSALQTMHLE